MLEILLPIILGILAGTITGLVPGVHINLVAVLLLTLTTKINISSLSAIIFIVSMATTHTFIDFIPSVFLGAPDPDTVLSVLPGHRYLLQGKGFEAVKISLYGSILGLILVVLITPLLLILVPKIYELIQKSILAIIITAAIFVITKEKKKLTALSLFLLAGCLGIASLNLNLSQPLFPLLSGLFGTSGLILSLKQKTVLPKQIVSNPNITLTKSGKYLLPATAASGLTGFLPGLGAAQAAIIGSSMFKEIEQKYFIFLTGAINTIVMIIGLIALIALNKTRSGAIVVVQKLTPNISPTVFIILIATALLAGSVSCFTAIFLAKKFTKLLEKVNYKLTCKIIIYFIILLAFLFSGWLGLLILAVSTAVGILPSLIGIQKNNLMGCLLVPVILFFIFIT
jgi:putative membrane protein